MSFKFFDEMTPEQSEAWEEVSALVREDREWSRLLEEAGHEARQMGNVGYSIFTRKHLIYQAAILLRQAFNQAQSETTENDDVRVD